MKRKKKYLFLELFVLLMILAQYIAGAAEDTKEGQAVKSVQKDIEATEKTEEETAGEETKKLIQAASEESIADVQEQEQKIRVLLTTTEYQQKFHQRVKIKPSTDCTLSAGDETVETLKAGKSYVFKTSSSQLQQGTVVITPKTDGKITVCSIRRTCGNPSYRGTLTLQKTEQGIVLVNELLLEEYLYAVVPSEMPVSYGIEALKVQAVCARCYAYSQLDGSELKAYGADVDDSTAYQVYNNVAETMDSIKAVDMTKGKIPVTSDGKMITAYYYSTSCGYTANFEDAWERTGEGVSYLLGKPQFIKQKEAKKVLDLSNEKNFQDFLQKETRQTFDSAFPWYRWKVSISKKKILKTVQEELFYRMAANPSMIELRVRETLDQEEQDELLALLENITAENKAAKSILHNLDFGTLEELQPVSRSSTGMLTCVQLTFRRFVIFVYGEYNIRCLLAPNGAKVFRQDGSSVSDLTLLPSSFFFATEKEGAYLFEGGGYGHGVGMSQNGVKTMAEKGYSWEEILQHYYDGVTIGDASVCFVENRVVSGTPQVS